MPQIKIYGIKQRLAPIREQFSRVIHQCVMEALAYPADKRFHRFFLMEKEDMLYSGERSDAYTIIEISMMEGRSVEAKKKLVRLLFDTIRDQLGIAHQDVEICIYESPASNWGFRGMHGDEIRLDYKVNV